MADTLENIVLPVGQWVDLYAATGIAVGTQLQVQNLGTSRVQLVISATQPGPASGYNLLRPDSLTFVSQATPSGAWARSPVQGGLVNAGEA